MNTLETRLPGCRISHNQEDSLGVDWNGLICAVRRRPRDNKWIVVIHDISADDELDTAPTEESLENSRNEAIEKMCELADQMISVR